MKDTNCRVAALTARLHEKVDKFLSSELDSRGIKDLQPCHGDMLFYIGRFPGIGVSDLAVKCHRTKSTVSILCAKMQKAGYLERYRLQDDKRASGFYLTRKAEALENDFQEISDSMNSVLTDGFSEQEIEMFEKC